MRALNREIWVLRVNKTNVGPVVKIQKEQKNHPLYSKGMKF